MPDYHSAFDAGEYVSIADSDILLAFQRSWEWHHPLSDEQLAFAGKQHQITGVSYYHCGAPLYELASTPGFWHESCLRDPTLAEGYDKEAGVVAADHYTVATDCRGGLPVVIVRDQSRREMLVAFHFDAEQVVEAIRSVARLRSRISFEWKYGFSGIYEANKGLLAEPFAAPDCGGIK